MVLMPEACIRNHAEKFIQERRVPHRGIHSRESPVPLHQEHLMVRSKDLIHKVRPDRLTVRGWEAIYLVMKPAADDLQVEDGISLEHLGDRAAKIPLAPQETESCT
jgi:hypothetical protein